MSQLPNNSASFPPELPTPDSYGQTFHKQNFETTGETTHLNVNNDNAGVWTGGIGGFKFSTINSTLTTPIELLNIDTNGMTIDKSSGGAVLVNLPTLITANASECIFSFPPALDTFGIQYGVYDNPVQVLFNSGVFTTGITYYAQATNAQTLRFRATTNPSDPLLDCSSFSNGQIPWAFVQSNSPQITQIVNLNETLTITTDADVSVLSATDLTFNTVSLPTTVSTNTTNIGTNTTNIATNTTNINTLQIKQTTTSNQYISAVITADARPPIVGTTTITQQFGYTPAWYFRNSFTSGINKINWYLGGDIGMTVADVLGVYMNIFNPSMTSNDNCPFIVILTNNDTPNPPNWYKSKRTYLFNQSITPVVNTRYFMFSDVSGTCPTPFHYGSVLNNMELSTVAGSNVGAFAPTETILAFSIHTNSASAINTVEFATNKFGIMTPYGTQEILFIPST